LTVLDDGRYDAFIVWAEARIEDEERDDEERDVIAFELTITSGVHKGEVVELRASNMTTRDPIDLVGLPCTLVVDGGVPRIET
jgi:hypothetical protein